MRMRSNVDRSKRFSGAQTFDEVIYPDPINLYFTRN